ncbi:VanZ family protein [Blautia sp. RD014234]|nr:VanZ family protein [Blautia parvula]
MGVHGYGTVYRRTDTLFNKRYRGCGEILFAGLAAFFAAGLTISLLTKVRGQNEGQRRRFLGAAVLAGYLCMLLFITFLSREPGSRDGIDWMPFSTLGSGPRGDAFVLENVLLFVPFGVLLPVVSVKMRRVWSTLCMGCAVSLSIELFQFLTKEDMPRQTMCSPMCWGRFWGMPVMQYFAAARKNTCNLAALIV